MNFDSLKTLMDGFDPGTLLPDLTTMVGKLELVMRVAVLVGPVLLLAFGLVYFFAPPKEANHYFGYRCWFGMGSLDAWRFTQRLAGLVWMGLGLVLGIIMVLVSVGFAGREVMDMLWLAVKCVIWEAAVTVIACLCINTAAAIRYNSKGERRKSK